MSIIYNDIIKDNVYFKKPVVLFSARLTGKTKIYQLIRDDLLSQVEELNIINIKFKTKEPKIELKTILNTNSQYAYLWEYFANSSKVSKDKVTLIHIDKIEVLNKKGIAWMIRNIINLVKDNDILVDLGIHLFVESNIHSEQLQDERISPFLLDFNFPREIPEKIFKKQVAENLISIDFEESVIDELWSITNGDTYYTDKMIEILSESKKTLTVDLVLDSINKYVKKGAFNDPLKWYLLDVLLEFNNNNYLKDIDPLIFKIENNWKDQPLEFKDKCFIYGLVQNNNKRVKFRVPELAKLIYSNALKRVKKIENTIKGEIFSKIIIDKYKDDYEIAIDELKKSAYFGFINNLLIGKAERIDEKKIEILGAFDHKDHIRGIWKNKLDLILEKEGYFFFYDKRVKLNESTRVIKFFPIKSRNNDS